ncbi:peptide ABC transporter substrate-binding protein [Roseovarius sp. SK2]|uniref:peptide ABC transporter substrate-binding protein n=1 Tax=Roseovarius TaxID=74030 RepID=UPI00237A461B|nr:peptide ABC transporter substrate-binding protein [Roseovarius sp. SK2]MDD9727447.1 peptide ABC transporter substrate-binding protein [Roseovarius sp. SK2]
MQCGRLVVAGFLACTVAQGAFAERASDGQVNLIFWQAPSILNPYLSGGIKDIESASLVLEPLARYDETGDMVPWLVDEIPTVENGGVSDDFKSITWRLSDDLTWSDGTPVTAADVKFSWSYCTAEGGGCAHVDKFAGITDIETPDNRTVVVRFDEPKPFPYDAFVGASSPILQADQFADCLGERAPTCTDANFYPIGTGPFLVDEFRTGDTVKMSANPNYRDPAKPAFASLLIKGGGTAENAARAVLETADYDYAWNLQLPPEVLDGMQAAGNGEVVSAFGTLVERIVINMTDPDADLGEERSTLAHPHPFLDDIAVRQALSMAIDRSILVQIGYGEAGRVTCNILPAPEVYASDANEACKVQDIEGAKALLDSAGWTDSDGDGVRDKDGVPLRMIFQTSTNAVRQTFQAAIKSWWSQLGVETELRNIDGNIFFGSDANSPYTYQKFYADVQMYAQMFDGTDPEAYMASWTCERIPTPENQWQGTNMPRYCNEAFDALSAELRETGGRDERAKLARAMNDMLVQDFVILPLVHRGRVSAHVNSLGGVVLNTWDSELWNVADWHRLSAE